MGELHDRRSLHPSTLPIHTRLHSIHADSQLVRTVATHYNLPVLANERCGSWYVPPDIKAGSAYFKSTDGHKEQWAFSLKRLNLGVLDVVGRSGGCIIVDSTRKGKVMPDALSKTVPIWCEVINQLLFPENEKESGLHTSRDAVSAEEQLGITRRIDSFVRQAKSLNLPITELRERVRRPICPIYITPLDGRRFPSLYANYNTIICLTASQQQHVANQTETNYIQGAGDDSENWGMGLTPVLYWSYKYALLDREESELEQLISEIVTRTPPPDDTSPSDLPFSPVRNITIARLPLETLILLRYDGAVLLGQRLQETLDLFLQRHSESSYQVVEQEKGTMVLAGESSTEPAIRPQLLLSPLPAGKLGSRLLPEVFAMLATFIGCLQSTCQHPPRILFACSTGTDFSTAAALVTMCLFYDGEKKWIGQNVHSGKVDKIMVKQRLLWITEQNERAIPSRATMTRVHGYLMKKPQKVKEKQIISTENTS